ncbi:EamA family transporter [Candidatus Roizmanbacteria bacterium]|nr:EamA family transporter [Candidatus Roizmanbacteria bacterium]
MNPILALVIANIIWGAASPIFKFALENIPPFTLAFIRFFFAASLFIPLIKKWEVKLSRKEWLELILGAFFGISVNITFFFWGLQRSQSINAPIIASSGPVFLYFLSILFLKEKAHSKVFIGMLIALLGVLLIILSPVIFDGETLALGELQGNLFFLLATLGAVLHPLLQKNVIAKVGSAMVTFISFLIGAVSFFPMFLFETQSWSFSSLDIRGWTGILFGVFLSSALAYFLFNYGISKIDTQEVGLFTYIDPVVAVLIAAPLLSEYPTIHFFFGSVLVFGGIYLAERRINWHPLHRLRGKWL